MSMAFMFFVFSIVLIALGFGGLAIRWDHNFKLRREELRTGESDNSLGTSELRELIQETMLDVIAPVEERLDAIEMHMRQLPENTAGSDVPGSSESVDTDDE